MHKPPHPGRILKAEVDELGLTVEVAARRLAVNRVTLSRVLNAHSAITPVLAIRLERAGLSTARAWVAMQGNYDLWKAGQRKQPDVQPFVEHAA